MALLDQFMQAPATILGLSVLNQADRPAQGLLQGQLLNQRLQGQRSQMESSALQRDLMNQQILKAQQEQDAIKRRQGIYDAWAQPQQLPAGQVGPPTPGALSDNQVSPAELENLAGRLMSDPTTSQMGVQLFNALKAPAQGDTFNLGQTPGETEFEKLRGKIAGKRYEKLIEQSDSAIKQNADLRQMRYLLSQGTETGYGEDILLRIKSGMETFGFPVQLTKEMGRQEVVNAIGSKFMTMFRSPESATGGLPGATSNKDLTLLSSATPGLTKTLQGNLMLLDYMERANNLVIEARSYAENLISQGVEDQDEFNRLLSDFTESQSILTEDERKQIEAMQQKTYGPRSGGEEMPLDKLLNAVESGEL